MAARARRLLIFDFDGLILDTEAPVYDAWQEIYGEHGCSLAFEKWAQCIGTADVFDPCTDLQALAARQLDGPALVQRHRVRTDALIATQPVLPGVREYVAEAQRLGMTLGVASSSSVGWVDGHLRRLGLRDAFAVVRCAGDVQRVKPDPALYLSVLEATGIPAAEALALEDSPNGVLAAKRAGLTCVAVPNPLTRQLSLAQADLQIASLADMPLPRLLAAIQQPGG